jgi:hypothetical protein
MTTGISRTLEHAQKARNAAATNRAARALARGWSRVQGVAGGAECKEWRAEQSARSGGWSRVQGVAAGAECKEWRVEQSARSGGWSRVQGVAAGAECKEWRLEQSARSGRWSRVQGVAAGAECKEWRLEQSARSGGWSRVQGVAGGQRAGCVGVSRTEALAPDARAPASRVCGACLYLSNCAASARCGTSPGFRV